MEVMETHPLTIGELSQRSGVAHSALRYYEAEGLIHAERTSGNQRRYPRDALRRVSFIKVAQEVGLSLEEISEALHSLPESRTPTEADWANLSRSWRPRIDAQIRMLERLRDRLHRCIGCGCLSLKVCHLLNPNDTVGTHGPGARYVIEEDDDEEGEEAEAAAGRPAPPVDDSYASGSCRT